MSGPIVFHWVVIGLGVFIAALVYTIELQVAQINDRLAVIELNTRK